MEKLELLKGQIKNGFGMVNGDIENLIAASSIKKAATLEIAIQLLGENLPLFNTIEKEIKTQIKKNLNMILETEKEKDNLRSRIELREHKEKMEVMNNSIKISNNNLEKILSKFNKTLKNEKTMLYRMISKRNRLFKRYEERLNECQTTDDMICLITSLKEDLLTVNVIKEQVNVSIENTKELLNNTKQQISDFSEKTISYVNERKQSNEIQNTSSMTKMVETESKTNEFSILGLAEDIRLKSLQRLEETGENQFVTFSQKHIGYFLVKFEQFVFKFHMRDEHEKYVYFKDTDNVFSILEGSNVVCTPSIANKLIFASLKNIQKI